MSLAIFVAVVSAIVFIAVAIAEGKHTMNKDKVIKRVYFYLVSLITLMTLVVSVGFLLKSALTSTLFTQADNYSRYSDPPPELYLYDAKGMEENSTEIICEGGCEFSASQKDQVETWVSEYRSWENNRDSNSENQRDIVTNLSLLLVALPLFIIHYRSVQKSAHQSSKENSHQIIRPTYFYIASLVGIVMIIIYGSMLINLGLKTYIFTAADDDVDERYGYVVSPHSETSMASIKSCQAACGFSEDVATYAEQYDTDYETWQNRDTNAGRKHDEAAYEIAYLLVAIPLFWYHWYVIRKESHEDKS